MSRVTRIFLTTYFVLLTTCVGISAAELIPRGAQWKFRPGQTEASSPTSAWRSVEFNDAGFSDSPAPFWYGDSYPGGTQITGMRFSYRSIFLRHSFQIDDVDSVGALRLGALVDDGFIAWINGTEVRRVNVNTSNPTIQTLASGAADEPPAFTIYELLNPSAYLREGENVLAVQVFNTSQNSSDLGFDASLESVITETIPPVIESITPVTRNGFIVGDDHGRVLRRRDWCGGR